MINPFKMLRPVGKAIGRYTTHNQNPLIKWTSRIGMPVAGGGAFFGGMGYMGGRQQAQETMAGVGHDVAQTAMAKQMENMPWWQKELAAVDPSLVMVMGERSNPGLIKNYETRSGKQFKPGLIGSLFNQNDNTPQQYVYSNPASGGNTYL